jgi:hypothetical protein
MPPLASRNTDIFRDLIYGIDGVLDSGASWITNPTLGPGIDLNGTTSGKITIPHNSNQNIATFTISVWFRWDASPDTFGMPILKSVLPDDDQTSAWDYGIIVYADGDIGTAAGQDNTSFQRFDTNVVAGTLHHVALTCAGAGGTLTTYLDGQQLSPTDTAGVTFDSSRALLIGNSHDDATKRPINGAVFDTRLYDRACTDAQVAALCDRETRWELYEIPRHVWAMRWVVAPAVGQPMSLRGTTVPHLRQWQPRVGS